MGQHLPCPSPHESLGPEIVSEEPKQIALSPRQRNNRIFDQSTQSSAGANLKSLIITKFHANIRMQNTATDDDCNSIIIHIPHKPVSAEVINEKEKSCECDSDEEINQLWSTAVRAQQEQLQTVITSRALPHLRKRHGQEKYPDGTLYDGEIFKNYKHGQGKLVDWNGNVIYEGEWKLDKYDGEGTVYFQNTRQGKVTLEVIKRNPSDQKIMQNYSGGFENGLFHGYGMITYVDESTLYGSFVQGLPDGTLTFESGSTSIYTQWTRGRLAKILNENARNH